jgi:SM-20-related protein
LIAGSGRDGYAIVRNAVPTSIVAGLLRRARDLDAQGGLTPARIGRGGVRVQSSHIRGDRIAWLADTPQGTAESSVFEWLGALRTVCNRELLLGLDHFEVHYAIYPSGAGYARHRDRFQDDDTRVLSCVLYLNEGWSSDEGGEVRLFLADGGHLDVVPEGGTFVAFLSADFDHEVRPATRERTALTGWFRRRPLGAG